MQTMLTITTSTATFHQRPPFNLLIIRNDSFVNFQDNLSFSFLRTCTFHGYRYPSDEYRASLDWTTIPKYRIEYKILRERMVVLG